MSILGNLGPPRRHATVACFLVLFAMACSKAPPPPDLPPLPTQTATTVSYADVAPVIEARCSVCHGCYDAPCQVVLTSPEGIERGASKEVVYAGDRLFPIEPSRLFVDAKTTTEWRKRDFFSILQPGQEKGGNLVELMLELGAAHTFTPGERLPDEVDLDITRTLMCSEQSEFGSYVQDNPMGGMPYGTASLNTKELKLLSAWLKAGAPLERATVPLPRSASRQVDAWEAFLNGTSLKDRITARYLYEHWFLAHLYFDDLREGPFFRIVRSTTPPGQPIDEIATRRPYDDPGDDPFWYRLRPIDGTILHKTHTIYEIGDAKKQRLTELFLGDDWEPTRFPSYEPKPASNPFVAFVEMPAKARYQFFLDDAQYFVMTFIRGPVCRGQIATNVIEDHFFVAFVDPDHDLSVVDPTFLVEAKDDLNLPAQHLSHLAFGEFFLQYGIEQRDYLDRREALYDTADPKKVGPSLDAIWDGDGENTNALLTVFRHWNNATVERGWIGGTPKTAWVIDYPIFERIYYDLVAGFDVFGNVAHQASTRLYMDHLRMQAENNFLSFLPPDQREEVHASWYVDATKSLDYKLVDYLRDTDRGTRVPYTRGGSKEELFELILEKNADVAGPADRLNRCAEPPCTIPGATRLEQKAGAVLQTIAAKKGPWVALLPEVTRLRVRHGSKAVAYTLVHNRSHSNVAYMFDEEKRLVPADDTLTIVRGYLGSYPNFAFDVDTSDLTSFRDALTAATTAADLEDIAARFGVRRTSPEFWATMDWMNEDFAKREPTKSGLFDLGRYENL